MDKTWWLQIDELDKYQLAVIDFPIKEDCLIIGPPGSGKTNLLLLRASFLGKSGYKNYSIITFTRGLKEFLSSGASNYDVANDNAQTYFSWARQILAENGITAEEGESFDDTREILLLELSKIEKSIDKSSIADFILIDEIQDYTQKEIETIRKFAKYIYAVGDSRQRIHVASDTIISIKSTFKNVCELEYHYRNGIKICRLADGILNQVDEKNSMESTCQYNEEDMPSSVKLHTCDTLEDQIKQMIPIIENQLVAYPKEQIGILIPKNQDLETAISKLLDSAISAQCTFQMENDYAAFDSNQPIFIGTVHSTKGMEFRACHFLASETVKRFGPSQKKMAFTACTRAKTSLNVYHTGSLPPYFQQAFTYLEPKPAKPSIKTLFPTNET